MINELLCVGIEQAINRAINLNVNDAMNLAVLDGKRLAIQLTEFSMPLCLLVHDTEVFVSTDITDNDCQINASIASLVALKQQGSLTELIRTGQLDVLGELKVAQGFAQLAEALVIDWQSELANYIGDVATHKLVQFSQVAKAKAQFVTQQLVADSSEWLIHEQQLMVTQGELTHFMTQVNNTEHQVKQLHQRIAQLVQQVAVNKTK